MAIVDAAPAFFSEGERVRRFGEEYVVQTKGRWAGRPLEHEPWQTALLDELYLRRPDGSRVYKEALVGIARKNGKSTLSASLALYALMAAGEQSPEVYSAAASRDQARIIFDQSRRFVEASPRLRDYLKPQTAAILCPANNGVYRALASDAPLQYGLNPSAVFIDELWAHANPELYYALTTGDLAREDPLIVSITTAGFDRGTICHELYEKGLQLRREGGLAAMRDAGFLFWWYEAPTQIDGEPIDYRDPDTWKAANPSSWITVEALEREARRLPEAVFRRLHLNQWTETKDAWVKPWEWDALLWAPESGQEAPRWWRATRMLSRSMTHGTPLGVIPPGRVFEAEPELVEPWLEEGLVEPAEHPDAAPAEDEATFIDYDLPTWAGVDIGVRKDSAALVVAQFHGERLHVRARILDPADQGRAWGVGDIRAAIRTELADYNALRDVAFDPWTFRESAERLADGGLPMLEFPQTTSRMAPASERLYEMVVTGRLRHEHDEALRRHVLAAVAAATDRGGWRLSKRRSGEKIDGAIALAMAVDRAVEQHLERPEVNVVNVGSR